MFISQVHTLIHSFFVTQENTGATADGDTSCLSVRHTHKHSFLNTLDKTDATEDGDTSCSSVRYTQIHSLFNTQIIQTPRQMEVHQIPKSGTLTYTFSLILKIIQIPRQTALHHVHRSGTQTYNSLQYSR